MDARIDRNRGLRIKTTPDGVQVLMFGDAPGVYVSKSGHAISDEIAAEAGFDVRKLSIHRRKGEMLVEAKKKIDLDMADEEKKAAASAEAEQKVNEEAALAEAVLASAGAPKPLKKIAMGRGRWNVLDAQGETVVSNLSKAEAERFLK